jgi:tRNA nucleotidyltransferase (CCA-adding enzyme)
LKITPLNAEELREALEHRGASILFLVFNTANAVLDVWWGQLHRTRKALTKQLQLSEFKVLRDAAWSENNARITVLVFELEQQSISLAKKHLGPPLEFEKECQSFLAKYAQSDDVIAGPFIDQKRWVVEVHRKFTDAAKLLKTKVSSGGRDVGVAELIGAKIREDFQILSGFDIAEHYFYNEGFAQFLTEFLSGKPFWLQLQ